MGLRDIVNKIKGLRDNLPVIPYNYVPPCPKCQSKATGKLVKNRSERDTYYILREALKHGELIGFSPDDSFNSYCSECGCKFNSTHQLMIKSRLQVKREMNDRGTMDLLSHMEANVEQPKGKIYEKFLGI